MKHTYFNPNVKHQPDQIPQICELGSDGDKLVMYNPKYWTVEEVMTISDKRQEIRAWLGRKVRRAARMRGE